MNQRPPLPGFSFPSFSRSLFPYLELKSQLTGEDGTVTIKKPGPLLQPVTDYDISQLGRSCTFDQFKQALNYTRNKVLPTL